VAVRPASKTAREALVPEPPGSKEETRHQLEKAEAVGPEPSFDVWPKDDPNEDGFIEFGYK